MICILRGWDEHLCHRWQAGLKKSKCVCENHNFMVYLDFASCLRYMTKTLLLDCRFANSCFVEKSCSCPFICMDRLIFNVKSWILCSCVKSHLFSPKIIIWWICIYRSLLSSNRTNVMLCFHYVLECWKRFCNLAYIPNLIQLECIRIFNKTKYDRPRQVPRLQVIPI